MSFILRIFLVLIILCSASRLSKAAEKSTRDIPSIPDATTVFGPQASKFRYSSQMLRAAELARDRKKALPTKSEPPKRWSGVFGWRSAIVTTTFWIGERPTKNNPTPNRASSWDSNWSRNYGGFDTPFPAQRVNFCPASFVPRQNPFYVALPYNDVSRGAHKPEASSIIPWFRAAYQGPGISVLKGRWLAIRHNGRAAYAQWEDCGPFRTDDFGYVFGKERPEPNLNKGAGLDVSPAVRDYLGMGDTDMTDWRFVEVQQVPAGPWAKLGDNNPLATKQLRAKPLPTSPARMLASVR